MFKLFLDPGHGGSDSGAVGNGLREKDLNLAIAKKIRDILANEYDGVAVKMSRTGDTFPSLGQRTNEANSWGADFFLSIHINSSAGTAGTGFESYIYPNSSKSKTPQSIIHDEIMKLIGMRDRGKKTAKFHVISKSTMAALLTENGFINNPSDADKMKDAVWLDKVARGHVNGLEKAFNLKKKVSTAPNKETSRAVSEWARDDWEEVVANGYFDGSRPHDYLTRQEAAVVINRLRKNLLDQIEIARE